jgi:cob(I)alamin adenosyltransferase
MAKIYTRTGDGGETSLLSGGRVAKDHALVEAYGTLDELNSALGVLLSEPIPGDARVQLIAIQEALFEIGSAMADPDCRLQHDRRAWATEPLEGWIDSMDSQLEPLSAFVLPGGSRASALAHLSRTVCRRAERRILGAAADTVPDGVLAFVNRLSDVLFTLARWLNAEAGIEDQKWRPGGAVPEPGDPSREP